MESHMPAFTLLGRPTLVFRLVREFDNAAGIRCVYGVTLDGTRQTVAGVADVLRCSILGV